MRSKDDIQKEIIDTIVDNDFKGIVLSSVRTGKTRILLTSVLNHIVSSSGSDSFADKEVLVLYPNIDIKNSWINECSIIGCPTKIVFCTFASIKKVLDRKFDYIVVDEAHLLGEENQLPMIAQLMKTHKHVVLASGTYSGSTLKALQEKTGLSLIVDYSTEAAIKDGIVAGYSVIVHKYRLDDNIMRTFGTSKKTWQTTEYQECKKYNKRVENLVGQPKMFAAIQRMHFINGNDTLLRVVNNWIEDNKNKRFLLFAANEKIGTKFGLKMFNSKSKTTKNLDDFIDGVEDQLCLIKKGSAGITYPNLQTIVITNINSNGENLEQMIGRSLLTDTEDAEVHIFVSDESFQMNWLTTALCRVNRERISYVNY